MADVMFRMHLRELSVCVVVLKNIKQSFVHW
jgi:hypothetical protein